MQLAKIINRTIDLSGDIEKHLKNEKSAVNINVLPQQKYSIQYVQYSGEKIGLFFTIETTNWTVAA